MNNYKNNIYFQIQKNEEKITVWHQSGCTADLNIPDDLEPGIRTDGWCSAGHWLTYLRPLSENSLQLTSDQCDALLELVSRYVPRWGLNEHDAEMRSSLILKLRNIKESVKNV